MDTYFQPDSVFGWPSLDSHDYDTTTVFAAGIAQPPIILRREHLRIIIYIGIDVSNICISYVILKIYNYMIRLCIKVELCNKDLL
jgi:hypothetical protein